MRLSRPRGHAQLDLHQLRELRHLLEGDARHGQRHQRAAAVGDDGEYQILLRDLFGDLEDLPAAHFAVGIRGGMAAGGNADALHDDGIAVFADQMSSGEEFPQLVFQRLGHALHALARADDPDVLKGTDIVNVDAAERVAGGFKIGVADGERGAGKAHEFARVVVGIAGGKPCVHDIEEILAPLHIAVGEQRLHVQYPHGNSSGLA